MWADRAPEGGRDVDESPRAGVRRGGRGQPAAGEAKKSPPHCCHRSTGGAKGYEVVSMSETERETTSPPAKPERPLAGQEEEWDRGEGVRW